MDSSAAKAAGGDGTEAYRLPRTVEPETYHIEIEPNVASATFSGTLAIDAVVHEPIDVVVMNAAELVVSDVEIRTAPGAPSGGTEPEQLVRCARAVVALPLAVLPTVAFDPVL